MKIYTRTGDTGETMLYGGARVRKDDVRVEAYGTVDETCALLGVAATLITDDALRGVVIALQNELFIVGADLATPLARDRAQTELSIVPRIKPTHTAALEAAIDGYEAELAPLRQFILPGGSPASAALHHARTVARRAERCVTTLLDISPDDVSGDVLPYINRLADLLFVLARVANHRADVADVPWTRPE